MEVGIVEESIKRSVRKGGFPEKIVRLPFKPVFESCRSNGTSLNEVLKNLREENVLGSIDGDYIIFCTPEKSPPEKKEESATKPFDFSSINPEELKRIEKSAQEQLRNMTPEQAEEIRNMVINMSQEDKANVMKLLEQMQGSQK